MTTYRAVTYAQAPATRGEAFEPIEPIHYSGTLLEIVEWAAFNNLQWTELKTGVMMPAFYVERHDLKPLDDHDRKVLAGCRWEAADPWRLDEAAAYLEREVRAVFAEMEAEAL